MEAFKNLGPAQTGRTNTGEAAFRRRKRPWLRSLIWIGLAICLILGSGAWLGFTAKKLASELQSASDLLPTLQDNVIHGDSASAEATLNRLETHTAAARDAGSDPLWTAARAIPWLGANFQAASEAAISADDVARLGAAPLVSVFHSVDWKTLTPNGAGIDLAPIAAATPKLVSSAHAVQLSSDRLNGIDTDHLLPQVATPLARAKEQLTSLLAGLSTAADVASIAPGMLGADGPRHYLLLVENNAETRATGGIPGALAVMSVDKGKLSLESQSSASELGAFLPPLAVESQQQQIYSLRLGKYIQDVNLTPDFPSAAVTAQAMWERKFGQRVDGVVSVDPIALSYILDATGPVKLADPAISRIAGSKLPLMLTGKNVVPTLLSDVYKYIEQPGLQDVYFAGVAKEVFATLASGKGDDKAILDGLSKGVEEHRILVWSNSIAEQKVINAYPLGGAISGVSVSPAQFGVYFNDGTGAKMDYYVKRTVQLVKECTKDGYEQTTVRVTSTNTAPADAATTLPAYVTGGGLFGVAPGSVQTNIVAYGPVQANIETAKLDGQRTDFAAHLHSNRPVGVLAVMLAPGESKTIEFTFGKIVQHTEPNVVVTPTVEDAKDVILPTENAACG